MGGKAGCTFDCAHGTCIGPPAVNGSGPGICVCDPGFGQTTEYDALGVEGDPTRAPCDFSVVAVGALWASAAVIVVAYFLSLTMFYALGGQKTRTCAAECLKSGAPMILSIALVCIYRLTRPSEALVGQDFFFTFLLVQMLVAIYVVCVQQVKAEFVSFHNQASLVGVNSANVIKIIERVCKYYVPFAALVFNSSLCAIFLVSSRDTKFRLLKGLFVLQPILSTILGFVQTFCYFKVKNLLLQFKHLTTTTTCASEGEMSRLIVQTNNLLREINIAIVANSTFDAINCAVHSLIIFSDEAFYALKYVLPGIISLVMLLFFILHGLKLANRLRADQISHKISPQKDSPSGNISLNFATTKVHTSLVKSTDG